MSFLAVGTALLATGKLMEGYGKSRALSSQGFLANLNVTIADQNVELLKTQQKIAKLETKFALRRFKKKARGVMGEAVAAYGKAGVALEGTPEKVLHNMDRELKLDEFTIKYEGLIRQTDITNQIADLTKQAGMMRVQASSLKSASKMALLGGVIGAGSSFVSGMKSSTTKVRDVGKYSLNPKGIYSGRFGGNYRG